MYGVVVINSIIATKRCCMEYDFATSVERYKNKTFQSILQYRYKTINLPLSNA